MYYVYGGNDCSACKAAINELEKHSLEYEYYDVYVDMKALEHITSKGLRGIPQIYNEDVHVGGFKDLVRHLK